MHARDWRLTTAEILYHLPDHPAVLQTFIWQDFDLARSFRSCAAFSRSGAGSWRARCIRFGSQPPAPAEAGAGATPAIC